MENLAAFTRNNSANGWPTEINGMKQKQVQIQWQSWEARRTVDRISQYLIHNYSRIWYIHYLAVCSNSLGLHSNTPIELRSLLLRRCTLHADVSMRDYRHHSPTEKKSVVTAYYYYTHPDTSHVIAPSAQQRLLLNDQSGNSTVNALTDAPAACYAFLFVMLIERQGLRLFIGREY